MKQTILDILRKDITKDLKTNKRNVLCGMINVKCFYKDRVNFQYMENFNKLSDLIKNNKFKEVVRWVLEIN